MTNDKLFVSIFGINLMGTGKMAQKSRALDILAGDWGWVPKTIHNSSCGGQSNSLLSLPWVPVHICMCTHAGKTKYF